MKKITKLTDVAFHLLNKVNKKKLKINTLLIKNWEKIFGENHQKVKIKKITLFGKDNLLNFEFSIDSSISFELHTQMEIIKLYPSSDGTNDTIMAARPQLTWICIKVS